MVGRRFVSNEVKDSNHLPNLSVARNIFFKFNLSPTWPVVGCHMATPNWSTLRLHNRAATLTQLNLLCQHPYNPVKATLASVQLIQHATSASIHPSQHATSASVLPPIMSILPRVLSILPLVNIRTTMSTPTSTIVLPPANLRWCHLSSLSSFLSVWPKLQNAITFSYDLCLSPFKHRWKALNELFDMNDYIYIKIWDHQFCLVLEILLDHDYSSTMANWQWLKSLLDQCWVCLGPHEIQDKQVLTTQM